MKRFKVFIKILFVLSSLSIIFGELFSDFVFFDLFNHLFPLQILIFISTLSLLLALKKKSLGITLFVFSMGLLFFCEHQQRINRNPYSVDSKMNEFSRIDPKIKVISFNVLSSNNNYSGVVDWILASLDPNKKNIVFLTEITERWMTAIDNALKTKLPHSFAYPRKDNFGGVLYSDIPLSNSKILWPVAARELPVIYSEFQLGLDSFRFYGVHPLPPLSHKSFVIRNNYYRALRDEIFKDESPALCAGDFNSTPWSPHFQVFTDYTPQEWETGSFLIDSFSGVLRAKTWYGFGSLLSIPIDTVLFTPDFRLSKSEVGPDLGSDHRPVISEF